MVIESIASRDFIWNGWRPEVNDARIFKQDYVVMEEAETRFDNARIFKQDYMVMEEAETSEQSLKSKFADLPAFGIWKDRTESDDELLEELGSGWRGFAAEQ